MGLNSSSTGCKKWIRISEQVYTPLLRSNVLLWISLLCFGSIISSSTSSFIVMVSNLLHLHNHLDPTPSSSHTTTSPSSSTTLLSSSSSSSSSAAAAALLLFSVASVLSSLSSSNPSPDINEDFQGFSLSAFRALSTELIWSMDPAARDLRWRSSYGISYPVFSTIVEKLKPFIAMCNLSLPSDYAVAMVLSRLCHGYSSGEVARRCNLEPYLVSKITNMVTRLLATKLYPEFIKIPVSSRRVGDTIECFEGLTGLPCLCGAIDSTSFRLSRVPEGDGGTYQSRHGFPAVQLQVVADHRKIFWDACVKAPGGVNDATHFRDRLLYQRLVSGDVVWDKVQNVRGHPVRPYIVGDWCFPLLSFLLTPFTRDGRGTPAENAFDAALMKGRSSVVEAIGLLKARWKILQNLNVGINHAPQTIMACCVLHNLCQIAREPETELWKEPPESGPIPRMFENERPLYYYGENLRQALAEDLHQPLSSR
ncbi:ALP1-like-like protein [Drosera capensis]